MVKSVFRYFLIVAVLVLVFGFGTNAFSATLADAYGVLIGNGWSAKDALGFLGTSIAGTIAMNPGLAPAAAAGALSAYIGYKGAQLYDIYRDWRNLRTGIAMLNPVEYSQSMSVKRLKNGEYGWEYIRVAVSHAGNNVWNYYWEYIERHNQNGLLGHSYCYNWLGTKYLDQVIYWLNQYIAKEVPKFKDAQGKAIFMSLMNAAYNNMISGNNFAVTYTCTVVAALETDSVVGYDSTLGYRLNVDPQNISEDGVQYLNDPDAFYQWFLTNYMNGSNEGTFVTPTSEAYDEIRSDLQTIITQLNNLSSTGGVSEETLNQLKTEILNAMNTQLSAIDSKLSGVDTKLTDVDTKLSGVDTKLSDLDSDIASVKTSIDALSGEINETLQEGLEQEQGFWDRLMEWLDVTFFEKLKELLQTLFLPTEEQLATLFDIQLPEYQMEFVPDVSFSSESASLPISVFGASVDLAGYISQCAEGLRTFMNIFVSGMAAIFVIGAFRVHFNID